MNNIIICADDFGQNYFINTAILTLIKKSRINAVSVFSDLDIKDAIILKKYQSKVKIGLHLNFTESFTKNFNVPLFFLILGCFFRIFSKRKFLSIITNQVNDFYKKFGFYPDFIDGHQHIQSLPIIREQLIYVIKKYHLNNKDFFVRNSFSKTFINFNFKMIIINFISYKFNLLLKKNNINFNKQFLGIYAFNKYINYPKLFHRWSLILKKNTIIMTHPSILNNDDEIGKYRFKEFQFLLSDDYKKLNLVKL